jgi:hypothetical protein
LSLGHDPSHPPTNLRSSTQASVKLSNESKSRSSQSIIPQETNRARVGHLSRVIEHGRMNDLRGWGSVTKFRLSHFGIFYKFEKTRQPSLRTRTTTTATPLFGYRNFSNSIVNMVGTQTKWTAPVVRKQFLDFFEQKGHTIGMWRGSGRRHRAFIDL